MDKENTIEEPERFDLRSEDVSENKHKELSRIFPEVLTEDGKIDFDKLRLTLGGDVDRGKERYELTWPGKADCFRIIQASSLGTLRPSPEESVSWDTTTNLIIEGDNLEVLKLLQKSYLGKIKVIYIDPPYNTGSDFVYSDDYSQGMRVYLEITGQTDESGRRLGTNTESDGRFHSNWLSMMYPRIALSRSLLAEDGLLFVSIDDHEVANLRRICDELLGESSFLGTLTWITTTQPDNIGRARHQLQSNIEYVLVYSRCPAVELPPFELEAKARARKYPHVGRFGPCRYEVIERSFEGAYARPTMQFPILGTLPRPGKQWQIGEATARKLERTGRVEVVDGVVKRAVYPEDELGEQVSLKPFWSHLAGVPTAQAAKAHLGKLLGRPHGFETVKPTELIRELLSHLPPDALVLDFFAGSGTTAEAVLEANREDGGRRRFILVQLPEILDDKVVRQRTLAEFCDAIGKPRRLSEFTKERVRRVAKKLNEADEGSLPVAGEAHQDRGFRVFKLDASNFTTWDAQAPKEVEELSKQLELHVDHIRDGRSDEDLLFELLLKSGFTLETTIEELALGDDRVYVVADGMLVVCLARTITQELIDQISRLVPTPGRVVCLDEGFAGNDQLKVNANETFKTKGVESFRTV